MERFASRKHCSPTLAKRRSANFLGLLAEALEGIEREQGYLVAVSGGRDSMALLLGLLECGFRELVVCHLNHGLRDAESEGDEEFVRECSRRLGLRFLGRRSEVRELAKHTGESIELTARRERLRFFGDCVRLTGIGRIFLGHHAGDQVETMILHWLRGTGGKGLGAMEKRVIYTIDKEIQIEMIRPMLEIEPGLIGQWMTERREAWREDSTNASLDFLRNRIRHRVLPVLAEVAGRNFLQPMLRAAKILGEESKFLDLLVEKSGVDYRGEKLSAKALGELPLALRRRVVLAWLRGRGLEDAGYREVEEVLRLVPEEGKGQAVSKVNLPRGIWARRTRQEIYLEGGDGKGVK